MKTTFVPVGLVLLAAAPAALADTLRVPSEAYPDIQSAVGAAAPGDVILVSPGSYAEDVAVTGKSDIEIRGKGFPVIAQGGSLLVDGGSAGIRVRGLEFDQAAITVHDSDDVALDRLRIHDVPAAVSSWNNDGLVISRCEFTDVETSGVFDNDSLGVVVEKCRFENIGDHAVLFTADAGTGTNGAVIAKNRVVNAYYGFAWGGTGVVVEKNRLEGLEGYGMAAASPVSAANSRVSKNRVQTVSTIAILGGHPGLVVERNTVVGGAIQLSDAGHVVDRNRVTASGAAGILIVNGISTVTRNTVREAGGIGILVQGDGSFLDRNSVADSESHGIVVHADGCVLDRNSAARAGDNGFLIDGTGNTLTRNRAGGSGGYGLADTSAEGVNSYERNRFGTTQLEHVP